MPITEKQLDALEKQHQVALQDYGKKLVILRAEEAKLTDNIRNLNAVIDGHIQKERDILNVKISETEKLKLEAITLRKEAQELLYQAQAKNEESDRVARATAEDKEAHRNNVKIHIDAVSASNNDIAKQRAEIVDKQSQASIIIDASQKKIDESILEQKKIELEQNKLLNIQESIKNDIEVQKDLYFRNKQLLDNLSAIKLEMSAIKDKSDKDMADVLKIRDDLDKAQARIEKNSQEIIKRNDECKSREIKNSVQEQLLKDRKSALDAQEGRLNELKNNVNILLEKQQATAPAVPTQGSVK